MARGLYSALAFGLVACASAPTPKQGLELVLTDNGREIARLEGTPSTDGDCTMDHYSVTLGSGASAENRLRTVRICGPNGKPSSLVEYVDIGAMGAIVLRREQRVADGVCYVQTRQPGGSYKPEILGCSTLPKPSSHPVEFK